VFRLAEFLLYAIQIPLLVLSLYWLVISFFGLFKPAPTKLQAPRKRFALLVPAHNEEAVIGSLVDSLMALHYPKELYTVFVIADACSDRTAEIARERGAVALEHTYLPGEVKGKPQAIAWALTQINLDEYDAVAVFDADNLVSSNFLAVMNAKLIGGARLIQAYLDSKNPTDTWITSGYSVSYYYMNRAWQLARQRLGLGAAIGGTGFCVDAQLLKEVGWTARTLTEDLEFQMQCLLKGVRAQFAYEARVWDEKPLGVKASNTQRLRWARGHWQVCFKYAIPLLVRAITKLDFAAFDGFLYVINPGKIVLNAAMSGLMFLQLGIRLAGYDARWTYALVPWQLWLGMLVWQFTYILGSVKADSSVKPKPAHFVHLFLLNILYLPLFVWALVTHKNLTWNRTEHTRALSKDDVERSLA
jgi:cellulose synthase/poly-beta-1,6-N-acetylglucosamine synthase-like glycosyltransferase